MTNFIVGLFIGAWFGFFIAGLCRAAKDGDDF